MGARPGHCRFMKSQNRNQLIALTIFWISSALFAVCLFMYGFFPVKVIEGQYADKNSIPHKILNRSSDNDGLLQRRVSRLVFVVIDAFRWDFLDVPTHMPYIHALQRQRLATFLTARCHPPTATMPRVKALMTGSVPNYIDVVLNLGSDCMREDNLIHQAVANDLKVVFYGDEVWLNLFPDKFTRKEGTTSFFVSDYTEVDLNVTQHIEREMNNNDWDILILHYLGLDHIGHMAGPSSNLIPGKLREMDSVIRTLHEHLSHWDSIHFEEPSLLVVVGDHGMHDLGSHGGATLGEVLASLVLIESTPSSNRLLMRPEVSQIDLAPTLSILLGLPIPKSSLGVLLPYALGRLSHKEYLFALLYNAHQISNQFLLADKDGRSKEGFKMYLEAQAAHLSWLENPTDDIKNLAESLYLKAMREMSSFLVKTVVTFDLTSLGVACSILLQVLSCLYVFNTSRGDLIEKIWKEFCPIFLCGIMLLLGGIVLSQTYETIAGFNLKYTCIILFSLFILGLNCWILVSLIVRGLNNKNFGISSISGTLNLGCFLHVASLSSSSLIEEEHQTWYFFWTTLLLVILISLSERRSQFHVLGLLFAHRVLRKLNQTGDKWASLPDVSDWLEMPQHQAPLTFLFVSGILGLWLSLASLKCLQNTIDKVIISVALICIFLYRSAIGDAYFPLLHGYSRGVQEVNFFWIVEAIIFGMSSARFVRCLSVKEALKGFISVWMLASALLLKPCNIVLISYMVASSFVFKRILTKSVDCSLAHLWLGAVVYFYQGNSNSLSTINVAAGYVGAEYQNMLSAGFLVFIHTYSFPVLAVLLLWFQTVREIDFYTWKNEMLTNVRMCFLQRTMAMSVYCILVTFQRNHLFIWSVFAPKLLYEAVHCLVSFLLAVFGCILLLLCDG